MARYYHASPQPYARVGLYVSGGRLGTITRAILDRAATDPDALAQVLSDAAQRANDRSDPNGAAWAEFAADDQLQDALRILRNDRARGQATSAGTASFIRSRLDEMRQYVAEQAIVVANVEAAAAASDPAERAEIVQGYKVRAEELAAAAREVRDRIPGKTSFVGALLAWDLDSVQSEYRAIHDDIEADAGLTRRDKDAALAYLRGTADRELQQAAVASTVSGSEASIDLDWIERMREMFLSLGTLKYVVAGGAVLGVGYAGWRAWRFVSRKNPRRRHGR